MMRKGKEPASAPDDIEAPETVQDTRWLNGVNGFTGSPYKLWRSP